MTDDTPAYAYRPPEKKRGITKWILIGVGLLALLGFSTCTYALINLGKYSAERAEATKIYIPETITSGVPSPERWAPEAKMTQKTVDEINHMMAYFGPPEQVGDQSCNAQSLANTNGLNGTFVTCESDLKFKTTDGSISITWKKAHDDWLLAGWFLNYDDITGYEPADTSPDDEASADK